MSPNELRQMCRRGSSMGLDRRPEIGGPRAPWMQQRRRPPPPPIGPEFDLATGINIPGILSLRWGRETNESHKKVLTERRSM